MLLKCHQEMAEGHDYGADDDGPPGAEPAVGENPPRIGVK